VFRQPPRKVNTTYYFTQDHSKYQNYYHTAMWNGKKQSMANETANKKKRERGQALLEFKTKKQQNNNSNNCSTTISEP